MSPIRVNVSFACDSCIDLKIKCDSVTSTMPTMKCTQCIKRNRECTFIKKRSKRGPKPKDPNNYSCMETENNQIQEKHIDPPKKICDQRINELICDLSNEEIKFLNKIYTKEQLPQILAILRSTTTQPCPSMVIAGHHCHAGCIIR
ncbi:transcription factor [Gigaspora margarita]|uniref:Transcription factor n=1 Tax=Gigaspora margarita TaxID=4874 RepID=A0A8H4AUF5_GIGMA|nr:transcription factor [Gigaspora margarita]